MEGDEDFASEYLNTTNITVTTENTLHCNFTLDLNLTIIQKLISNSACYRHSFSWTILLSVAYVVIFICGLIGNSLVIAVVLCKRRMKTVTNLYILNLAVADLFVIVLCVPATLLANVFRPWILGSFLCKLVPYTQGVSVFTSVYSLLAVSGDRCWALYRPLSSSFIITKRKCVISIMVIWLTALIATYPWWIVFNTSTFTSPHVGNFPLCTENWNDPFHNKLYFVITHLLGCFTIPLILICFLNWMIWKHILCQNNETSANVMNQSQQINRKNMLKMLASLAVAFFASWFLFYIFITRIKLFGYPSSKWEVKLLEIVIPISQLLGSANSCINPFLYAFLNRRFRESVESFSCIQTLVIKWGVCIQVVRKYPGGSQNFQGSPPPTFQMELQLEESFDSVPGTRLTNCACSGL